MLQVRWGPTPGWSCGTARAAATQANLVPLTQWPSYGRLVLEWRTLNSPDCRAKIDFIATVNVGHLGSAAVGGKDAARLLSGFFASAVELNGFKSMITFRITL